MNKVLGREELFGVRRRKPTEPSSFAGAVQDRYFQTLEGKFLVSNLVECGNTNCESSLEIRRLCKPLLLQEGLRRLGFASDHRKGTLVDDTSIERDAVHLIQLAMVSNLHHQDFHF